jgi:hypothetical protein
VTKLARNELRTRFKTLAKGNPLGSARNVPATPWLIYDHQCTIRREDEEIWERGGP